MYKLTNCCKMVKEHPIMSIGLKKVPLSLTILRFVPFCSVSGDLYVYSAVNPLCITKVKTVKGPNLPFVLL